MSFLAGRLAGKEAAYFFQESKHAVNRLAEKSPVTVAGKKVPTGSPDPEGKVDALPEILRHSLPPKIFGQPPEPSSFSKASKWALHSDPNSAAASASSDVLNPLRAYVSVPPVTFGRKKWALPSSEHSFLASTANGMREDKHSAPVNPEKLKAAAEGLQHIGKAFAVATAIVFGGATFVFGLAAKKLDMHNSDDVRKKGHDLVHHKFETIREQVSPLRVWVENMSEKWRLDRNGHVKEKPVVKELSRILRPRANS